MKTKETVQGKYIVFTVKMKNRESNDVAYVDKYVKSKEIVSLHSESGSNETVVRFNGGGVFICKESIEEILREIGLV